MTPLGNRVFIAPEIPDKIGRFHLARMSRIMPDTGVITAISTKAAKDTGLQVGQRVFYRKQMQTLAEGEKSTMIDAEEILAVLE